MAVVKNTRTGAVIATRVDHRTTLPGRLFGLLNRAPLEPGEALWLDPCGSVHTWGMRGPIDVVFLDASGDVLGVATGVPPWRVAMAPRGTRSVLETRAGGSAGVCVRDRLMIG
jgi:uncharacterized protein